MIENIRVQLVAVTAFFVLASRVIAYYSSLTHFSLVVYLGVHVQETPIFEGQMGDWILAVGDSGLEVIVSEQVVEPGSELGVSDSGASEVVELSDFVFIGHEVRGSVGGERGSQAVASHTK